MNMSAKNPCVIRGLLHMITSGLCIYLGGLEPQMVAKKDPAGSQTAKNGCSPVPARAQMATQHTGARPNQGTKRHRILVRALSLVLNRTGINTPYGVRSICVVVKGARCARDQKPWPLVLNIGLGQEALGLPSGGIGRTFVFISGFTGLEPVG